MVGAARHVRQTGHFLVTQHGLLRAFIQIAIDIKVELVLEELRQEQENMLPIIMQLAVGCSD